MGVWRCDAWERLCDKELALQPSNLRLDDWKNSHKESEYLEQKLGKIFQGEIPWSQRLLLPRGRDQLAQDLQLC